MTGHNKKRNVIYTIFSLQIVSNMLLLTVIGGQKKVIYVVNSN